MPRAPRERLPQTRVTVVLGRRCGGGLPRLSSRRRVGTGAPVKEQERWFLERLTSLGTSFGWTSLLDGTAFFAKQGFLYASPI